MIGLPNKIVVVAPHPDDETLGAGGTIARFAASGVEVSVLIVSGHLPPLYPPSAFETTRTEANAALSLLGAKQWEFLEVPATKVHEVPVAELNGKISGFIRRLNPEVVLMPFPDRHIDHRVIFDASVVACRPVHRDAPNLVLAYETLRKRTRMHPELSRPSFPTSSWTSVVPYDKKRMPWPAMPRSSRMFHPGRFKPSRHSPASAGVRNGCEYAEAFKVIRMVV